METIAWYKHKEGLFYLSKEEKAWLYIYFLFLLVLVSLLFVPFPNYQKYIAAKEENHLLIPMPSAHFSNFEKSKLYIKEKRYDFVILKKEEGENNMWLVSIEIKGGLKEENKMVTVKVKGEKQSKISQFMEKRKGVW